MISFARWHAQHRHLTLAAAQECYADYCRLNRPLDEAERAALAAFRREYGREWKQYLMAAWLSHKYKGLHMGGQDTGVLRQIRNTRGHGWLIDLRPADLEPPTGAMPYSDDVEDD